MIPRNVKRALIMAIALFWLLPAQVTFAAKDCYEVEDSLHGLSDRKALNKVKTQLRLHLKAFNKKGSDYEGQFDIACLTGLFMSMGEPSSAKVLERFNRIEEWGVDVFGSKKAARESMERVWRYKKSEDLLDQERKFGYENSEWVILALANNLSQINFAQIPVYPIDQIKDQVWCNKSSQLRRSLNQKIKEVADLASALDNWEYLSKSQYDKVRGQFKTDSKDLKLMCGEVGSISSNQLNLLREAYNKKTESFASEYWSNFIDTAQVPDANWDYLFLLDKSCRRSPTDIETNTIKKALDYQGMRTSKKWYSNRDRKLMAAASDNGKQLRRIAKGILSCYSQLTTQMRALEQNITTFEANHKKYIAEDIRNNWKNIWSGSSDNELERRLKEHKTHIRDFTKIHASCIQPNSSDQKYFVDLDDFRSSDGISSGLFLSAQTAYGMLRDRLKICQKDAALKSAFGVFLDEIELSLVEYKEKAENQALEAWRELIRTQGEMYESSWEGLNIICNSCAPNKSDVAIIQYLTSGAIHSELKFSIREWDNFSTRVSRLENKDPDLFGNLIELAEEREAESDDTVLKRWKSLLNKPCKPAPRKVAKALNPGCSYPLKNEIGSLRKYCYLKELRGFIQSEKNKSGSGGKEVYQRFWNVEPVEKESVVVALLNSSVGDSGSSSASDFRVNKFRLAIGKPKNNSAELVTTLQEEFGKRFRDRGDLEVALVSLRRDGAIQEALDRGLKGCFGGYHKKVTNDREKLRKFYGEFYEEICDTESSLMGEAACNIADHLSHRFTMTVSPRTGQKESPPGVVTVPKEKGSTIITRVPVEFRSNVHKDSVTLRKLYDNGDVDGKPESFSTKHRTFLEENRLYSITLTADRYQSIINYQFRCCDVDDIKRNAKKGLDVNFTRAGMPSEGIELRLWFHFSKKSASGSHTTPPIESEKKDTCYAVIFDKYQIGDSPDQVLTLQPLLMQIEGITKGGYVKLNGKGGMIAVGHKIGSYRIAHVGKNYLVLWPTPQDVKGFPNLSNRLVPNWDERQPRISIYTSPAIPFQCRLNLK